MGDWAVGGLEQTAVLVPVRGRGRGGDVNAHCSKAAPDEAIGAIWAQPRPGAQANRDWAGWRCGGGIGPYARAREKATGGNRLGAKRRRGKLGPAATIMHNRPAVLRLL